MKSYLFLGWLAVLAGALFVVNPRGIFYGFSPAQSGGDAGLAALILENENLKNQIAVLRGVQDQLPPQSGRRTEAFVYSRYPFNLKNEIMINAGGADGIPEGAAVIFRNYLVGKTVKVFENSSLAITVFDSRFQTAVRVGEKAVDALFVGGGRPKLTLIPKNTKIAAGDRIYSAGQDFPYGLPLGEVENLSVSPDQSFVEATVRLDYDLNAARAVSVENASG